MDQLTKAARAAGYAMGVSDDLTLTSQPRKTDAELDAWRTGRIEPMHLVTPSDNRASWRQNVAAVFGWKATA